MSKRRTFTREEINFQTAVHEAGHVVVGDALGFDEAEVEALLRP